VFANTGSPWSLNSANFDAAEALERIEELSEKAKVMPELTASAEATASPLKLPSEGGSSGLRTKSGR
jgi:hypothetical protein